MAQIIEKITEPTKIYVGSTFKLKIKVKDIYFDKCQLVTESGIRLITEDGNAIITEWGV